MINLHYKGTSSGLMEYLDRKIDELELSRAGDLEALQADNFWGR